MRKNQWQDKCLERSFNAGAPQGSILGPFIFKVFLNDRLHKLGCLENFDLYNYADDNTADVGGKTPEEAVVVWKLTLV